MEPSARNLRVLCLDGGGIRGLSEILILKELMLNVRMRNKLKITPEPYQCFDLICGTSTGGLIAILLGRLGKTLDECEKLFRDFGSQIFSGGSAGKAARLVWTGARHASDGLEKIIRSHAAEETMFEDEAVSEGHVPVAVVSVMKITGDPELFRTYGVRASVESCSLLEACRATSAATTFFPSITINGVEYVDGAFGFNNPSDIILEELKSIEWPAPLLDPPAEIDCLVSIGTGRLTFEPETSSISSLVKPRVVKSVSDALKCCKEIATNCHRVHERVAKRFKDAGFANRYYRFDVDRGLESIELNESDDKTMQHISAVTRTYMKRHAVADDVAQCSLLLGAKIGTGEAPIPDQFSPLLFSTLPQSTHSFYGRQTELSQIREALDPCKPNRKNLLLCGIGGSGKTQLVLRHIEEEGQHYSVIVWIDASTEEHASQSLSEAAVEMASRWPKDLPWFHNRPGASDAMKVTSRLRSTLHLKWLLVIDSADDTKINLSKYIPDCNHGSVLVTSTTVRACRGFSPDSGSRIDVGGLDLANSRSMLLALAKSEDQTTVLSEDDSAALKAIVGELSGIPLAIEQAAALVRNGNFSFQKFLSAYKQKYRALMEEPPDEGSWAYDKDRIILTVLDLAYASLTGSSEALLLVFIGIMGSWEIPISVLERFAFFHHTGTKSVVDEDIAQLELLLQDENFFRLALHRLAKFFFIRLQGDQQHQSIAIHRIFSQWSLEKMRSLEKEELLIHIAYGLSREVCHADPEMKSPLPSYLKADQVEFKYIAPFKYSLALLLSELPQGLLNSQSGRLHDAYCTIIRQAAWTHLGFGDVDEAKYYFSQAIGFETVALCNCGLQWPYGRVALCLLWGLAHTYRRSGDLDGAVDSLQSALRLCESLYPDDGEEAVEIVQRLKEISEKRENLQRHHKNVILASGSTEVRYPQSKIIGEPAGTQPREPSATTIIEESREEMELDAEEDVSRVLLEAQKQGAKKVAEKEKEVAKVEDILNQLEGLAVPGIPRDHIRFALNSKYAEGNVQKAVELIRLYQEAFAGIVVPYNPHTNMLGAENRGGVTCYLDAVLFAMFAKLEAFECMLRNDLADKAQRKLACLIRLWVNMLRSGKLIHTDVTEHLQDALAACGWEDAHLLEQQDTSEAFAFITETLQLPLLQLRVDLFHQGKWDADDRKIVYERLLNLAVPPDPEGKGVKLEECLWGYFNNQVDVIRDSPEEEKIGDRPMLSSSTTMRLVTEQDNSEAATDYEPTPLQQRWTMPGSSASTSSTEPQLLTPRHRSTSIIQRIVLDEQGKPTTSDVSSPSLLEKVKHQGSMVAKPVTIPAWQFFRIIPWYATSNTEPRSDIEIVRQFSQGPIVAMCLKRYIMTESGLPKRQNTFIDIPDSLELTHYMMVGDAQISESNNLKTGYKLVLQSVVCHRGDSLHSGHYVTFARVNPKLLTDNRRHEHDPPPDYEDAHWVKFDDLLINNRVSSVDDIKESLKEETPYLLFYQILPTIDVARVSTEEDTERPPYNDYNLNVTSTHAPNIEPDRPGTAPTTPGTYQTHMPMPIDDYDTSFTWSD